MTLVGKRFLIDGHAATITAEDEDYDEGRMVPVVDYTLDTGEKKWIRWPSRRVKAMPLLSHTNIRLHQLLTDEGAYTHEHVPCSFEDDGDGESGPHLIGGPAFDVYRGDSHDIVVDCTGLMVHVEAIDWDLERFFAGMEN